MVNISFESKYKTLGMIPIEFLNLISYLLHMQNFEKLSILVLMSASVPLKKINKLPGVHKSEVTF